MVEEGMEGDELERRVAKIEDHLDMKGVHNRCDRCGRLDTFLFKVCGTFWGEKRYCFRCVAYIYIIGIKYWLLGNKIGVFALLCAAIGITTAVLIHFWG